MSEKLQRAKCPMTSAKMRQETPRPVEKFAVTENRRILKTPANTPDQNLVCFQMLTLASESAPRESRVTQGWVAHRPHGWHSAFGLYGTFGCVAPISCCATISRWCDHHFKYLGTGRRAVYAYPRDTMRYPSELYETI